MICSLQLSENLQQMLDDFQLLGKMSSEDEHFAVIQEKLDGRFLRSLRYLVMVSEVSGYQIRYNKYWMFHIPLLVFIIDYLVALL